MGPRLAMVFSVKGPRYSRLSAYSGTVPKYAARYASESEKYRKARSSPLQVVAALAG